MPRSLLSKLLEAPEFEREVIGILLDEIIGRPCLARPAGEPIQGEVVDYEFTGPMVLGLPEGEGLRYDLPFESRGVSSGKCHDGDGDYTFAQDGAITGTVRVELGPDTLQLSKVADILDGTIIEILIDQVDVDELEPAGVPPENFAGES